MAWVEKGNGNGYFMTVTLYDRNQDDATLTYELRSADMAAALVDALAVIAKLEPITQGIPVAYSVSQRFVQSVINLPSGGEMQIKARVAYRLAAGQGNETFDVPAPAETIFVAPTGKSNNIVNVTNTALVEYADLFKTTGKCFISDGEALDAMTEGRKVSVKKGMRAG